jgi:hypothetical protein
LVEIFERFEPFLHRSEAFQKKGIQHTFHLQIPHFELPHFELVIERLD